MRYTTLSELRQEVLEVLRAIEFLERRYGRCEITIRPATEVSSRAGSQRDRIRALITERALTVAELADATGLTRKQVRGVLDATKLRDSFQRTTDADDASRYRWVGSNHATHEGGNP